MTITAATFKTATIARRALKGPVDAYLKTRAAAEVLREKVDAVKARVLRMNDYTDDMTGARVLDPSLDWTIQESQWSDYNARSSAAVALAIPHDLPDDYCPALVAESAKNDAEDKVLEVLGALFDAEFTTTTLEIRAKALENAVGLVLR